MSGQAARTMNASVPVRLVTSGAEVGANGCGLSFAPRTG